MQVEVQYQQLPLSRLLKQLENNELDAVLLLAQNPDRQQRFVYPEQPFLLTRGALAVRTEIQTDANSFLNNPQYSIAIWQQGYQSSLLQNFAGRFVGLSGEHISARAAEMLEKDRVDAFYEPDIYALRHNLEHHDYGAHFYILELPQDQVPLYTVFSSRGAVKYLQSYQQALLQQSNTMPYVEYLHQWLATEAAVSPAKTPVRPPPSSH